MRCDTIRYIYIFFSCWSNRNDDYFSHFPSTSCFLSILFLLLPSRSFLCVVATSIFSTYISYFSVFFFFLIFLFILYSTNSTFSTVGLHDVFAVDFAIADAKHRRHHTIADVVILNVSGKLKKKHFTLTSKHIRLHASLLLLLLLLLFSTFFVSFYFCYCLYVNTWNVSLSSYSSHHFQCWRIEKKKKLFFIFIFVCTLWNIVTGWQKPLFMCFYWLWKW